MWGPREHDKSPARSLPEARSFDGSSARRHDAFGHDPGHLGKVVGDLHLLKPATRWPAGNPAPTRKKRCSTRGKGILDLAWLDPSTGYDAWVLTPPVGDRRCLPGNGRASESDEPKTRGNTRWEGACREPSPGNLKESLIHVDELHFAPLPHRGIIPGPLRCRMSPIHGMNSVHIIFLRPASNQLRYSCCTPPPISMDGRACRTVMLEQSRLKKQVIQLKSQGPNIL